MINMNLRLDKRRGLSRLNKQVRIGDEGVWWWRESDGNRIENSPPQRFTTLPLDPNGRPLRYNPNLRNLLRTNINVVSKRRDAHIVYNAH